MNNDPRDIQKASDAIEEWIASYRAMHIKLAKTSTPKKTLPQRIAEAKRRKFTHVLVTIEQAETLIKGKIN